ncbi:hypothetical protein [Caviibacter abscessus]|uniref:hypothetical protein n=1 Tax=Caviibacter abscessus TaxID=1766719 RepID=UPI0008304054|nr:hypothetical protein [Caviibacter abscessus]
MKKDINNTYLTIVLNILLAVASFITIYNKDKLTAWLLSILLILPPVVELLSLRQLFKINPNLKKEKLDPFYDKLAILLYLGSIASFIAFAILYKKLNVTILSIGIIMYTYGNIIKSWSVVRYDKNILVHRNNTVNISKILNIDTNTNNKTVTVKYFNNDKVVLKLKSQKEIENIVRILRRK